MGRLNAIQELEAVHRNHLRRKNGRLIGFRWQYVISNDNLCIRAAVPKLVYVLLC